MVEPNQLSHAGMERRTSETAEGSIRPSFEGVGLRDSRSKKGSDVVTPLPRSLQEP